MRCVLTAVVAGLSLLPFAVFADEPLATLRILALDYPQAQVEQRLADTTFTPKTGIKVVLETNSVADVQRKLGSLATAKDSHFDLVQYDGEWLGQLVSAGALLRLDTAAFFAENAEAATTNVLSETEILVASTNTVLKFADFRPEITYRVAKYPTNERDLFERRFDKYADTPIYGMPWSTEAQILVYRVDLVEGSFARVQPSVAQYYNEQVAPNWKDQWQFFVTAAGLVQIVKPSVQAVFARASAAPDGILQDFLPILWSHGGELWNETQRKAEGVLNSASNIKALDFYCGWNLKKKIVSPESIAWGNAEAVNAMIEGKTAMGLLWPHLTVQIEDSKRSQAAGQLGYVPPPGVIVVVVQATPSKDADPAVKGALGAFEASTTLRQATLNGCVGVGINAFSTQQRAAWRYMQWLLSRQTQLSLIFEAGSGFISARKDLAAESRGAHARNKAALDEFDAGIVRSRWNIPEASQLDAILARECNLAFRGSKSPKDALDTAAKEIQAVLDKSATQSK